MRVDNNTRLGGLIRISLIFYNMKVCCVFSLESPHWGDSNEYTQYTIFNIKMKITWNYPIIPWLFPDFSLIFYSFPYPLTDKKSFLFFTLMVLTVSLQIWAYSYRKEFAPHGSKFFPLRAAPLRRKMGLDYLKEHPFPSWTEKINFLRNSHLFSNSLFFPWFSKSFLNFPDHPWNSLPFSWPGKNFIFQIFFPDRGNPECWMSPVYAGSVHHYYNAYFQEPLPYST